MCTSCASWVIRLVCICLLYDVSLCCRLFLVFKTTDVLLSMASRPGRQLSRLVGDAFLCQLDLIVRILARLLQQMWPYASRDDGIFI
jgi:hypothetical protein